MKRNAIVEVITLLNVILFLYAGIAKVMDYSLFREQLALSPVLKPVAQLIAIGLPVVEFAIVILLIVPRWRLKGLYSSFILLTIFLVYIIVIMLVDDHLPCSCGGLLQELSWKGHIVFNSVFIVMNGVAIWMEKRAKVAARNAIGVAFG